MNEDILNLVTRFLRRYVVLDQSQVVAIALWVIHTHAIEAAETTPYIAVTSPEKGSGKTRLLEVLEQIAARAWFTGRVTAAVLTRKVDKDAPTLLLDESDAAFAGNSDYAEALRGVLNSGYRRGGKASVCVAHGSAFELVDFSTFCPKAIAGLGQLPDTVTSRSIVISLKRRAKHEHVERFRFRDVPAVSNPIRDALAAWAEENKDALAEMQPALPEELSDRQMDVWEPLLAIAELVGGGWELAARKAALDLSAQVAREDDDSRGVRLLRDCRGVFEAHDAARLFSSELVERLNALEEAPWGGWSHGRGLDTRALARLLKPFGVRPHPIRIGDKSGLKGYERELFGDAWERYLAPQVNNVNIINNGSTKPNLGSTDGQQEGQQELGERDRDAERRKHSMRVMSSSESNEWPTPQWFFDELNAEFNFTLDPASTHENAKCPRYFTEEDDGLAQDWTRETVFVNPPFGSQLKRWIAKASESAAQGATVVCLIPARPGTNYWHELIHGKAEVRYPKGRLRFGDGKHPAPFDVAVVIFRPPVTLEEAA